MIQFLKENAVFVFSSVLLVGSLTVIAQLQKAPTLSQETNQAPVTSTTEDIDTKEPETTPDSTTTDTPSETISTPPTTTITPPLVHPRFSDDDEDEEREDD